MRPPRIAILVLFLAASLFLFCRSIGSLAAASPHAAAYSAAVRPSSTSRPYLSGLFAFSAPFTLFPPNAAISLTDDNSTTFAARPAAFGPTLPNLGLSGQVWVGGGFGDDALQGGDGELGCGDSPGWEDGRAASGLSSTPSSFPPATPRRRDTSPRSPLYSDSVIHDIDADSRADGADDDHHLISRGVSRALHDGVQSMPESAEIVDKIVLLSRGGCGFVWKVRWAQRRGARAVIIGDNQKGGSLIQMFAKGDTSDVTIPSVFTARMTALVLSSLSQPGGMGHGLIDERGRPIFTFGPSDGYSTLNHGNSESTNTSRTKRSWLSWLLGGESDTGGGSSVLGWMFPGGGGNPADIDSSSGKGNGIAPDSSDYLAKTGTSREPPTTSKSGDVSSATQQDGLISKIFGTGKGAGEQGGREEESSSPSDHAEEDEVEDDEYTPQQVQHLHTVHEGLWVTLAPTSSASPFFDTLLVLVISPLITLVVVYALLIIRARIRRRRWRAPKSVIDRLPIRTYHTVAPSPTDSPRLPSPTSSSPATPLLQQATPSPVFSVEEPDDDDAGGENVAPVPGQASTASLAPGLPHSTPQTSTQRPRSRTTAGVVGGRSALQIEKRSGQISSQWRKYMSRQVECVVCLEEYVDGVSQVMSLPCGHEFHAECITPWLTTRRRTCPICKGDVVRSLARGSSSSNPRYSVSHDADDDGDSEGEGGDTTALVPALGPDGVLEDDLEQGVYTSSTPRGHRPTRSEGWLSGISGSFVTPSRTRREGGPSSDEHQ